ncbi:carboxypeptidase-like regulatory domain-containing protein [Fluviicola sp.]|uniref:carboxypeptidase-like regulatory domain-containing protein n=1 Tax=Fluviicola sp. TaxID=1917219 RepID=UPI0031CFD7FE
MASIPRPKHCGQNWLDMAPVPGGRICAQCEKKIVDFSKSSWAEIEKQQKEHNNSLCGMYHPKQLENWGREIPKSGNSLLKAAAITGITVSIATTSYGQNHSDSLVIEGRVIDKETGEELPFAIVRLKSNSLKTATDMDGNFRLVLKNVPSTSMPDTLEIDCVGYPKEELVFRDLKKLEDPQNDVPLKNGKLDIMLHSESEITTFYVHMPSRKERMKRKIRSWFGK